ncbi:MAG TPA: DISARM system phospholipase D-like protein DrmC [Pseudonocardiaceae bacterium]|nr:DISARM system phospholipase D-like protein DrmC [Pseudonocardiaceae bacterium]
MTTDRFEHAVSQAIETLGPARLRALAEGILGGHRALIPGQVAVAGFADVARTVLAAQEQAGLMDVEAAAYLRGVAVGYAQRAQAQRVESVWTGPSSHAVPVRATAQVLVDVVAAAHSELLLMTYSAKPYPPLLAALSDAIDRGVAVSAVVETLQGAGSALSGAEPATAFASIPAIQLWHWPLTCRTEPGAKMHAKLAVADRTVLLVSSANLTSAGVSTNLEAGLLIRGGTAPLRAAEHIRELKAQGVLARLTTSNLAKDE